MPTKQVTEYVMGELVRDGDGKTYHPKLKLTINEFTPDEELAPVKRSLVGHELTPMSGMVIEDGKYRLRYMFDGEQQQHSVHVRGGRLLAA
jgi:hypothetical protein